MTAATIERLTTARAFGMPQASPVRKQPRPTETGKSMRWKTFAGAAVLAMSSLVYAQSAEPAAQATTREPGSLIVTGFSGSKKNAIDPDGISARIVTPQMSGAAAGQLIGAPATMQLPAKDIGQVFAGAVDDSAGESATPSIYLGATSLYGLSLVDMAGGTAKRIFKGSPRAIWMPGQFATDKGGGPGAIWKVDANTGNATLFADLQDNTGPGIGDIVFDKTTRQLFVSDLDSGVIVRLDTSGKVLDSFDHGQSGRMAAGLPPIADDRKVADIKSTTFDTRDPATWGFTQGARMVWGMAIRNGRLYYAVQGDHEIWSVGINLDGTFAEDARREIVVKKRAEGVHFTDMAFDSAGHLLVAERGALRTSDTFNNFADAGRAEVLRFAQDPATGTWSADPESYAIGLIEPHKSASGGIALGACGTMLWTTGDKLKTIPPVSAKPPHGNSNVHGLQGNDVGLVRPRNVPPLTSVFVDLDGKFRDAEATGHVGDIENLEPCQKDAKAEDFVPAEAASKGEPTDEQPDDSDSPTDTPPIGQPPVSEPPGNPPPPGERGFNLRLTKRAAPHTCVAGGTGWFCRYVVRVTNVGSTTFAGPIRVRDHLGPVPGGTALSFAAQPAWNCVTLGGTNFRCTHTAIVLLPGNSVDLMVRVHVPQSFKRCQLRNAAKLAWPTGKADANPADDADTATALVPNPDCKEEPPPPPEIKTNLKLIKELKGCEKGGSTSSCDFNILVTNAGSADYNGQLTIRDVLPAGATATFDASWQCTGAGPSYDCSKTVAMPAGSPAVILGVVARLPNATLKTANCQFTNRARITFAPGGSPQNTDATDDTGQATGTVPDLCDEEEPPPADGTSNLKISKTAKSCTSSGEGIACSYDVGVINTGPDAYNGTLKVRETLPSGITATFGGGWFCTGALSTYDCLRSVNLPSGAAVTLSVDALVSKDQAKKLACKVHNQATILLPLGSPHNTDPGDDRAEATATISGLCGDEPPTTEEPPPKEKTNLKLTKTVPPGETCNSYANNSCRFEIVIANRGPGTYSGQILIRETIDPGATLQLGSSWSCVGGPVYVCNTNGSRTLAPGDALRVYATVTGHSNTHCEVHNQAEITWPAPGTDQNTFPDDDAGGASGTIPALCVRLRREPPRLTDPIVPPEKDPPIFDPPVHDPRDPRDPPGEQCPPGTVGKPPYCDPVGDPKPPRTCPPGWHGTPPECCPPNWPYRHGQCLPPEHRCPPGQHKSEGRCCPNGTTWLGHHCGKRKDDPRDPPDKPKDDPRDPPGKKCPPGTVGTPPYCDPVARKCPEGTVGRHPNCRNVKRECPDGMVGRPPNCRKPHKPERQCRNGLVGRYPNCYCPRGQVMKHGDCVERDKPKKEKERRTRERRETKKSVSRPNRSHGGGRGGRRRR